MDTRRCQATSHEERVGATFQARGGELVFRKIRARNKEALTELSHVPQAPPVAETGGKV